MSTMNAEATLDGWTLHTRRLLVGFVLLSALWVLPGCGGDQSAQWLETAQFEERQQNIEHARELYQDIIREYPNSPAAATARERLTVLSRQSDSPGSATQRP